MPGQHEESIQPSPLDAVFRRLIASTGPISVAHYMAEANAHYYNSRDPLGGRGDFVTAPEISQMFGEMIGLWLTDIWQRAGKPALCHYVELGPGRGTLASDAMRVMAAQGFSPHMHFVETSQALRAEQRLKCPVAEWHDGIDSLPRDAPIMLVANEFLDALPVRQLVATEQGWRERMVDHDGIRFVPVSGSRPMNAAVPQAIADQAAGTILETHPAAAAIAYEVGHRLKQQGGVALFIDYGHDAGDTPLFGSSLQAVRAHRKVDPFAQPGDCDLTAHVDFGELRRIALSLDLAFDGTIGQGGWLLALGIQARASQLIANAETGQVERALHRLVDPDQMGALFRVGAMRAPSWPSGEGFG